ncbi:hypothetical protein C475_19448 [Halosimplex carlsbadense 2-9-1]|uniref:DUF7837 domain-containing protein n=1 Tax=Halosimplex carlsbadense 2-9-1 TaxID=797114 RepID=M0CEL5_9EURY|nr:hypothetical protein C475_19448 [Halosimplex carlsbadense 2-9-1]
MPQHSDSIGSCPECGSPLHQRDILVEYDTDTTTRYYVECPECLTVVHPA